jgi:hypothetical protein
MHSNMSCLRVCATRSRIMNIAGVAEWYTRWIQNPLLKGLRVQVPPPAQFRTQRKIVPGEHNAFALCSGLECRSDVLLSRAKPRGGPATFPSDDEGRVVGKSRRRVPPPTNFRRPSESPKLFHYGILVLPAMIVIGCVNAVWS